MLVTAPARRHGSHRHYQKQGFNKTNISTSKYHRQQYLHHRKAV
jgi:hypothetical protein